MYPGSAVWTFLNGSVDKFSGIFLASIFSGSDGGRDRAGNAVFPASDGASPSYGVCQATEKRVSGFSSF